MQDSTIVCQARLAPVIGSKADSADGRGISRFVRLLWPVLFSAYTAAQWPTPLQTRVYSITSPVCWWLAEGGGLYVCSRTVW